MSHQICEMRFLCVNLPDILRISKTLILYVRNFVIVFNLYFTDFFKGRICSMESPVKETICSNVSVSSESIRLPAAHKVKQPFQFRSSIIKISAICLLSGKKCMQFLQACIKIRNPQIIQFLLQLFIARVSTHL